MIVINSDPVLGPAALTLGANNPRIGWRNLVAYNNVFADQEAEDEPVSNLANPDTYSSWRGLTTAQQEVALVLDAAADVNYFAIAKHNLGSSGATVTFESSINGADWTTVVEPFMPANDFTIIHEFNTEFAGFYRLLITPGVVPPAIAVWYVGEILILQRRLYVGHVPLPFGRRTTISTGRSESGQFLGRIKRRGFLESSIDMNNLTPDWVRENLDPFIVAAETQPFFWAWRPSDYPLETGYAWLTDDPQVVNSRANGMMQVSLSMQGIR
jgi:hypothetical protein